MLLEVKPDIWINPAAMPTIVTSPVCVFFIPRTLEAEKVFRKILAKHQGYFLPEEKKTGFVGVLPQTTVNNTPGLLVTINKYAGVGNPPKTKYAILLPGVLNWDDYVHGLSQLQLMDTKEAAVDLFTRLMV